MLCVKQVLIEVHLLAKHSNTVPRQMKKDRNTEDDSYWSCKVPRVNRVEFKKISMTSLAWASLFTFSYQTASKPLQSHAHFVRIWTTNAYDFSLSRRSWYAHEKLWEETENNIYSEHLCMGVWVVTLIFSNSLHDFFPLFLASHGRAQCGPPFHITRIELVTSFARFEAIATAAGHPIHAFH